MEGITEKPFVSPWLALGTGQWQQVAHHFFCTLALIGGVLLCFLITKYSPRDLYPYKYFLLYFAVIDTVMAGILLLGDFHPLFFARVVVGGIVMGPFEFRNSAYHLFALFLVVFLLKTIGLPLGYYYRYLTLFNPSKLKRLPNKRTAIIISTFLFILALGFYLSFCLFAYRSGTVADLTVLIDKMDDKAFGPLTQNRHIDFNNNRIFVLARYENPALLVTFGLAGITVLLTNIYIFAVTILIMRLLNEYHYKMTIKTYLTHRRLLIALTVQAVVPLLNVLLPVLFMVLPIINHGSSFDQVETLRVIISCGPVVNSYATMVIVYPYRRALLKLILGLFRCFIRTKAKNTMIVPIIRLTLNDAAPVETRIPKF